MKYQDWLKKCLIGFAGLFFLFESVVAQDQKPLNATLPPQLLDEMSSLFKGSEHEKVLKKVEQVLAKNHWTPEAQQQILMYRLNAQMKLNKSEAAQKTVHEIVQLAPDSKDGKAVLKYAEKLGIPSKPPPSEKVQELDITTLSEPSLQKLAQPYREKIDQLNATLVQIQQDLGANTEVLATITHQIAKLEEELAELQKKRGKLLQESERINQLNSKTNEELKENQTIVQPFEEQLKRLKEAQQLQNKAEDLREKAGELEEQAKHLKESEEAESLPPEAEKTP